MRTVVLLGGTFTEPKMRASEESEGISQLDL